MRPISDPKFFDFVEFFPLIELPVTLTDESVHHFSKTNKILPEIYSEKFIFPYLEQKDAEYREIIPCFRIPDTHDFFGLIFWEGGLMSYHYNLVTFDKSGNFISGKVIAGTDSNGEVIQNTVATIDPEWMIHIVTGKTKSDELSYNAESSKAFTMELLADGEIIFSLDE